MNWVNKVKTLVQHLLRNIVAIVIDASATLLAIVILEVPKWE